MIKQTLLLCVILGSGSVKAQVDVNGGLSGSWYDPETEGQGLFLDIFADQSILFGAWFTFPPASAVHSGAEQQRWMTLQGSYSGNVAELIIYSVTGGEFDTPTQTDTTPVGQATLIFDSCAAATLNYDFTDENLYGSIPLVRLSPDLFCQEIADSQPPKSYSFNLPPEVYDLSVEDTGFALVMDFSLFDTENDIMDVSVKIIDQQEQGYEVPQASMRGHVGYPVINGTEKRILWDYSADHGLSELLTHPFQIEIRADDRFAETMQDIVDLVSSDRLVADIQAMEGVRHHAADPARLELTRNYLRTEMNDRQLPVENQLFTYQGSQGVNIIATLPGSSENGSYYVVDGHYDSVTTTPGADDNASGTAGMLEVMRVLSQFNSTSSIRFIGFDKEELGLRGSRYYAANIPPGETVLGLINFEMIGYTCRNQPECINNPLADTAIYNVRSSFAKAMSDVFINIGNTHVPSLKIVSLPDDGDSNLRRSDHAPFWDLGVDALFLNDGANFRTPHYHQPTDQLKYLDVEFLTGVVKTSVGTLATVAGVSHVGSQRSRVISLEQ